MAWERRGMVVGHGRSLPGWSLAKGTCPAGGTGPLKWTVLWFVGRVGSGRLVADIWLPRAVGGAPTDTLRIWVSAEVGIHILFSCVVTPCYWRCVLVSVGTVLVSGVPRNFVGGGGFNKFS